MTLAELVPELDTSSPGVKSVSIREGGASLDVAVYVYDHTLSEITSIMRESIESEMAKLLTEGSPDLSILNDICSGLYILLDQEGLSDGPVSIQTSQTIDDDDNPMIPPEVQYEFKPVWENNTFRGSSDRIELLMNGSNKNAWESFITVDASCIVLDNIVGRLTKLNQSAGLPVVNGFQINGSDVEFRDSLISSSVEYGGETIGISMEGKDTLISNVRISGFDTSLNIYENASGRIENSSFDSPVVVRAVFSVPDVSISGCTSRSESSNPDVVLLVSDSTLSEAEDWAEEQKVRNPSLVFGYQEVEEEDVELGIDASIIKNWEEVVVMDIDATLS